MTDVKKTVLVSILIFMLLCSIALNSYIWIIFNKLTIQGGDPSALKGILIGNIIGSVAVFVFILSYVFLYEQGYASMIWDKIMKEKKPSYPPKREVADIKALVKKYPANDEKEAKPKVDSGLEILKATTKLSETEKLYLDIPQLDKLIDQDEAVKLKEGKTLKRGVSNGKEVKLGFFNDLKNKFRLMKNEGKCDKDMSDKLDKAIEKLEQRGYGDDNSQYIHLIFLILSCIALGGSNIASHFTFNNLNVKQDDNYKIFNNLIYFAPWMYFSIAITTGAIWWFFYYAGKGEEECNAKVKKAEAERKKAEGERDDCKKDKQKLEWKQDERQKREKAIIDLSKEEAKIAEKKKAIQAGTLEVIDVEDEDPYKNIFRRR